MKIQPGPKVGYVLAVLLDKVLDDPKLNEKETLTKDVKKLGKLSEKELAKMAAAGREKAEQAQQNIEEEIKRRYFVK